MARITTYATLVTAAQDYLQRADTAVDAGNMDYLIGEVEEEMNTRLRVQRMLAFTSSSTTLSISAAGAVTNPTDFLGWKRFVAKQGGRDWDLDLLSAEEQTPVSPLYSTDGVPRALLQSIAGLSKIWPYTNGVYTFDALYYQKIPQLVSGGSANWVITNYPSTYLYGVLAAAAGFSLDDEPSGSSREDKWLRRFKDAIKRIEREDKIAMDARKQVRLTADTTLFGGMRNTYDVIADY